MNTTNDEARRIFSGVLQVQAVPVSDLELKAAGVPEDRWQFARIGYSVDFKGSCNLPGIGGCIGAIMRSFMHSLEVPPGRTEAEARAVFVDIIFREALESIMSGVHLQAGNS